MAAGYDGSIRIDTKVNSSGMTSGLKSVNTGINTVKTSLLGLASAVGLAFGVAALINFGKASIDAATNLTNAMTGLKSIMDGQGRSFADAQKFINSYISDGLVPATNAVTAYKNLASRGYTDPQIQQTLLALKDSAAFGRQASLSLGDAVQTATEGLKNENSVLVDNAGVTKNVSVMWKDYAESIGTTSDKLTKQQKIQAETAGIMQETKFQTGDAAKVASTYSGEVLKLGFNFNNLKIAIGNALIPIAQAVLPSLNSIISALTRVFTLFSQVATAIFGKQVTQTNAVASATDSAVKSQNALADATNDTAAATKKEAKAATDAVAPFDDLSVLAKDSTDSAADATDAAAGAGGGGALSGGELGAGTTVSPDISKSVDKIMNIFSKLIKWLSDDFGPVFGEAFSYISPALDNFKSDFAQMWSDLQTLSQPFFNWIFGDFETLMKDWVITTGKVWGGLLDTGEMIFSDLWNIVVFPSLQKFVSVGLPVITQFSDGFIKTMGVLFDNTKTIFDKLWSEGVAPSLSEIIKIWSGMWDTLAAFWDKSGIPIFDSINKTIESISSIVQNVWDTILQPIWQAIIDALDEIWTDHLQPLAASFLEFVGELVTGAMAIYNQVIAPIINWLVQLLGPTFVSTFNSILGTVKTVIGIVIDVLGGVITIMKGIIEFLTGVFTGNWSKAWQGVSDVFKGIMSGLIAIFRIPINAIIDMLNGLIGGINQIISGLNQISFGFPDDFPIKQFAGMSFGIDIPNVKTIPHLAQGAVIPPNHQFPAILGDQTSGTNIEAPLSTITQAVSDAFGDMKIGVEFKGNLAPLIQILKPEITRENTRIGAQLVTGGGRY